MRVFRPALKTTKLLHRGGNEIAGHPRTPSEPLFFAGAGHLYLGETGSAKVITMLVISGIAWLCAFTIILFPITVLAIPVFIYAMVDSFKKTKSLNSTNGFVD